MIPFENSWPYEKMMNDFYFSSCPFCDGEQVYLPLKKKHLQEIRGGKKHLLVMPCCHERVQLVDVDEDYLLADRPIRKGGSS